MKEEAAHKIAGAVRPDGTFLLEPLPLNRWGGLNYEATLSGNAAAVDEAEQRLAEVLFPAEQPAWEVALGFPPAWETHHAELDHIERDAKRRRMEPSVAAGPSAEPSAEPSVAAGPSAEPSVEPSPEPSVEAGPSAEPSVAVGEQCDGIGPSL